MTRWSIVILSTLLAGAALAQQAPSESEQRFACMGDAVRLCSQFIPDREQIRLCLGRQHEALSAGCRPVYDASMRALAARSKAH